MSYTTIGMKYQLMQFFIFFVFWGWFVGCGVCFHFCRVFKNHVPKVLQGNTKHHFLSTFVQKLVRYVMIYIYIYIYIYIFNPLFWLYVASASIKGVLSMLCHIHPIKLYHSLLRKISILKCFSSYQVKILIGMSISSSSLWKN